MAHPVDLRVLVDRLLLTGKTPVGEANWGREHRDGDSRLLFPLLIDGEISDADLIIIAYPRMRDLQFRIILTYERAIWRVDFNNHETHQNSFRAFQY